MYINIYMFHYITMQEYKLKYSVINERFKKARATIAKVEQKTVKL